MPPSNDDAATEEPGCTDHQDEVERRQLTSFRRRSYIAGSTEYAQFNHGNEESAVQGKLSQSDLKCLLASAAHVVTSARNLNNNNLTDNDNDKDKDNSKLFPTTTHRRNVNGTHTVVAFINSSSGGGKGTLIHHDLVEVLGADYVFDLKTCTKGSMPQDHLMEFARDPNVRVLACGGDGTMGWIESAIDMVWKQILGSDVAVEDTPYAKHLPLALMPLGTGNDLSRSFGWGATYKSKMRRPQYVSKIATAAPSVLDRWRCVILPDCRLDDAAKAWVPNMLAEGTTTKPTDLELLFESTPKTNLPQQEEHQQKRGSSSPNSFTSNSAIAKESESDVELQSFDGVFCNYLSIGFDAQIAFAFHKARQKHPERFNSTIKNKITYVRKSTKALKAPLLHDKIKLLVATSDGSLQPLPIPRQCRSIMLLNIQSYGGGNKLSNVGRSDDRLIEVLFLSGVLRMATAAVTPLKVHVAAQTNHVCFRTSQALHCQVDGEPWLQSKGFFQITHHSQNAMLTNVSSSTRAESTWSCVSKQDVAE